MTSPSLNKFIKPQGGYRALLTYQRAEIIYDATVYFVGRFFPTSAINGRDRTVDQMVQAARSGKQNIAEGSSCAGTSKSFEIKLTNVARASLHELLEDYRDFLRARGLNEWERGHRYANRLKELLVEGKTSYHTLRHAIEHSDPEICANVIIGLIKVTSSLLYRQIGSLETEFIKEGGVKEAMYRARKNSQNR